MARSMQPTYVVDADEVLHIEEEFVAHKDSAPVSTTRCGVQLENAPRVFHLTFRHLCKVIGCRGCLDA